METPVLIGRISSSGVAAKLILAMACGAALLTEDVGNGLRELFAPGEDLLVYRRGDPAEAAEKALSALADPDRLAALAASGRRRTLTGHTVAIRARRILATARRLAATGAVGRRLARLARIRAEVAKAYLFLATDQTLPLPPDQRQFFLEMAGGAG